MSVCADPSCNYDRVQRYEPLLRLCVPLHRSVRWALTLSAQPAGSSRDARHAVRRGACRSLAAAIERAHSEAIARVYGQVGKAAAPYTRPWSLFGFNLSIDMDARAVESRSIGVFF
jgi:hypothetical protein